MPANPLPRVLALDAMGVIYRVGDDVADLLIPFIRENGGSTDRDLINDTYIAASLGKIPASRFWQTVGLDAEYEDRYLETLELSPGLEEFLTWAGESFDHVLCLSNGVSEWSLKLRRKFGLEKHIQTWVIGGDVGHRKPAAKIYEIMITQAGEMVGALPGEIVFIDDRIENLDAAKEIGLETIYFNVDMNSANQQTVATHTTVQSFDEIQKLFSDPI